MVVAPNPMFRGVGPASADVLAERDREQRTVRRVEQVRTRLHATSVDARSLISHAARALVLGGVLTNAQVTDALLGLNNGLAVSDRLNISDINSIVSEIRGHSVAALAQPENNLPDSA